MASIAELHDFGTTLEVDEAVAIVQQLISRLQARHGQDDGPAPYGPLSAENVFLNEDGSVSCRGCKTRPTLSEVGIFLHKLLPPGLSRVPGSLRHTIACALLTVDMPTFDSLGDFSRDLGRQEHGVPADVVRRVLARSGSDRAFSPFVFRDRSGDARRLNVAPPRRRMMTAAAACLVAGLALIATGETLHGLPAPIVATQTAPIAAETTMTGKPRVNVRRISMARAARPATAIFIGPQVFIGPPRAPSMSRLDRLHLGWLRMRFVVRDDL